MLTSIEIEGYRGIQNGRVDHFGETNLFIGPNGSGKSTLLEAIFLGSHEVGPHFAFRGAMASNELPLVAARHNEHSFPSPDCWYRKDTSKPISIRYFFKQKQATYHLAPIPPAGQIGQPSKHRIPESLLPYFSQLRLLDTRVLLDKSIEQEAWDQLLNTRADRQLAKRMNDVYGLNLESFSYSARTGSLKTLFSDRDFALNIDDLGAGMRIAFRLFISVLLSKNSAVLAEEFDGYQHIESFPRFARTLLTLAKSSRTQLFLATHSLETVRIFASEAASLNPAMDLKVFQTNLTPDGSFTSSSFSASEASKLLLGGYDLRKTD